MGKLQINKIKKDKHFKNELNRAHIMIALLAISTAVLAVINSVGYIELNTALVTILVILCGVTAVLSATVVVALNTKR